MIQITEHFRLSEFLASQTASEKKIKNSISLAELQNIYALCVNILEPLRKKVGPVWITSGYRCKELNAAVGGVANSQHCEGKAADIGCSTRDIANKYFAILKQLDYDQLIWEETKSKIWIHVSYNGTMNRHQKFVHIK